MTADVFGAYARFYDLLYAEKDYAAECAFLEGLFATHGVGAGAGVLDLGCGTGGHALPLAQAGFRVTGVDRSEEMLAIARDKAAAAGLGPEFLVGDVRDVDLGRTFDAVISMFAVMGYQLTNEDLAAAFGTVRRHLAPGGIFVFDAWFGPAVLTTRPEPREKRFIAPDGSAHTRIARPTLDVVAQTVRVDYEIVAEGEHATEASESHTMRFLFAQEVAYFLGVAGFEVVDLMPFMHPGVAPTDADWNVTWVARAV